MVSRLLMISDIRADIQLMAFRINVGGTTDICDIPGCGRPGAFTVGRPYTTRFVCGRCMEELVTYSGWKTLTSIGHPETLPFEDH